MAIPSPIIRVNAVAQSGVTAWSSYGPQVENLLITIYSDFQTMFNAFTAGSIDITDWPVQPADTQAFSSNPDFFVTAPESQFSIVQLDINRHNSFLGVPFHQTRPTPTPGIKTVVTSPLATGVCAAGQNRYTVVLDNVEEANTPIKDPLNKLSITQTPIGSPSRTVAGNLANNIYSMGCLNADNYKVKTSIYRGEDTIASSGPSLDVTVTLGVAYNSDSNSKETQAGIDIGRAIAHMLDKPNYQNVAALNGQSDYPEIQAPPAQGLIPCPPDVQPNCGNNQYPNSPRGTFSKIPQAILDLDKADHTWFSGLPISLYNLLSDTVGCTAYWWATDGCGSPNASVGYSGPSDLRAACEHLVKAGFTMKDGDCQALANVAQGSTTPACANTANYQCPHLVFAGGRNQVIMYIRSSLPRRAFGQIIADTLQLFFGTPKHQANNQVTTCVVNYGYLSPGLGCTPQYYSFFQISDIVFSLTHEGGVPPGQSTVDDWHLYTGGNTLNSIPDHWWPLYNSKFTGGTVKGGCTGTAEDEPNNYNLFCDPQFDTDTTAGQFAADLKGANSFFARAAIRAAQAVMTIPVFTPISQFAALNAWSWQPGSQSSLVAQLGHGFQYQSSFYSLLNMRCNQHFTPTLSKYRCGGGDSDLIRRGFSGDVHKLSIFQALTVWDLEVLFLLYDSLLSVNPRTGGSGSQIIDWGTISHSSSFNPGEVSCVPTDPDGPGPILQTTDCHTGTTTQTYQIRNDLMFHSGQHVTADDFCFTVLTIEHVPSTVLSPFTSQVASCAVLSATTARVKLVETSPFYEMDIGGLPVLRAADWDSRCGWIATRHDSSTMPLIATLQTSQCASPDFDPMQAGIINGDGPWMCKTTTGLLGGPCTSSGTQDVTLGGTMALKRYEDYARCCPNLQGTSLQKESWADKNDDGKVDILDIADAALSFGVDNEYWDHPLFGVTPGIVDIGEIATIAFYFDHGITKPYAPNQLLYMDPQLDAFGVGSGPGGTDSLAAIGLTNSKDEVYYQGVSKASATQLRLELYYRIVETTCVRYTWQSSFIFTPGNVMVGSAATTVVCNRAPTSGGTVTLVVNVPASPTGTILSSLKSQVMISTGPSNTGPFSVESPIFDTFIEANAPFP